MYNCKQILVLIALIALCNFALAQVEINKPIVFTAKDDVNNVVKNISTTSDSDLISAKEAIFNQYQYAVTSLVSDTIYAKFTPEISELNIGLKIYLKLSSSNYSITYIKIDNLPKKRIYINHNSDISSNLNNDEVIVAIYDGTSFQIIKNIDQQKTCPSGFVEINNSYCVSQFRQGPGNFKDNYDYCRDQNARICSWAEWYYACKNNSGQIIDMELSGNEWTNSGGNNSNSAKVAGNNRCEANGFGDIQSGSFYFRCCFSK